MNIVIINYNAGNSKSLQNAIIKSGYNAKISNKPTDVETSDIIFIAGVGSAKYALNYIKKHNLDGILYKKLILEKTKYIGICLGMHILFDYLEEDGGVEGLGFIQGKVKKIESKQTPHVGWNNLIKNGKNYYFDHSYKVECSHNIIVDKVMYQKEIIPAYIKKENLIGFQFHPLIT